MERLNPALFDRVSSEFYLYYGSTFSELELSEGTKLYEELIHKEEYQYVFLISKKKIQNKFVELDEEDDCYIYTNDVKIKPDFYLRKDEIKEENYDS